MLKPDLRISDAIAFKHQRGSRALYSWHPCMYIFYFLEFNEFVEYTRDEIAFIAPFLLDVQILYIHAYIVFENRTREQ